jgi:hypothetical protein
MAWKGIAGDEGIYFSNFNEVNWAGQRKMPGVGTSDGPSLGVYNQWLYMAWKGISEDQGLYYSNFDGSSWASQQKIDGVGSSNGPTLGH